MKQETEVKLKTIEGEVSTHKEEVIKQLLEMVYDIKPELHINYREGKGQLPG
jgi:V-type H+-transporting ATPase subunit G